MPRPLRRGALVDIKVFGGFGLTQKDLRYHEKLLLAVSGSLHPGVFAWEPRWSRWYLQMSRSGLGQDWRSEPTHKKIFPPRPSAGVSDAQVEEGGFAFGRDTVMGTLQLDTDEDMPPPDVPISQIICMPIIDTRRCGKYALHRNVGFENHGVSGLLLSPAAEFNGLYRRIGAFDLFDTNAADLQISSPVEGIEKDMFISKGPIGAERDWRILLA